MELSQAQKELFEKVGIPLLIALVLVGVSAFYFTGEIGRLQDQQQQDVQRNEQALASLEAENKASMQALKQSAETALEDLTSRNSALSAELELTKQQTNDAFAKVAETIGSMQSQQSQQLSELKKEITSLGVEAGDFSGIVNELIPKVVSVKTQGSVASGAIIRQDGLIVTNYHVIEGKTDISVVLSSKKSYKAEVIGFNGDNDLAVLKIDRTGLRFFEYGNSDNIKVGEKVLALGNPLGLGFTVTQGIVSALNRRISGLAGEFIQTDVPINPGSSGGPLVNKAGELIGLNTLKVKDQESLGFAIPSNFVRSNVDEIIKKWEEKEAQ